MDQELPEWLINEMKAWEAKRLWQSKGGLIELWRVDNRDYGLPSFVVISSEGDKLFLDGDEAIEYIRELRREWQI